MTVYVTGVGTSHFGKQPDLSPAELAWTAIGEAFADQQREKGVRPPLDAIFVGSVFGEPGVAMRALQGYALTGLPIITVENACASGTSAMHEAAVAIRQGRYENVLVLGLEQMSTLFKGPIVPQQTDVEGRTGLAMPSLYAMEASRWLHEGRVTREQMASVSVKNHRHAMHNDRAQYRGEYTVDQVLDSPMISDPLTLLQCSPISDGAAAVVLSASGSSRDVELIASAQRAGGPWDHRSSEVWGYRLIGDTAAEAMEQAALGPGDVDLAEVHDAFTIGELTTTEALGLAPPGMAGHYAQSGRTALGGQLPVNPSGGLLSRGHPLGATGVAQVAEVVWQLRGQAGTRQVDEARVGLVETMGGGVSGVDGNACVVALFGRAGRNER
ncbi:thiolase family protein [Aeromicrobium wangtongii]|uniref:propanoyl-CoA C-acyltransferase n=1 Tax=Aeromicrobium wangtongii TaxID=2969247 RepID=A0ABY5M7V3_9ACTN|nr:thiolase family protein [Aeromicrobium wangtongii]MCD9198943.1 thiolase family protein [Aeromicrobium wangtongii]UUP13019.1 thiolase family protein [Aeromicrobium wangtongii]